MRASYDFRMRQMTLPADATIYQHYHEMAHDVQNRVRCLPLRAWLRFNGIRLLGYLAEVWTEYDAMVRTRHALQWVGSWSPASKKEGWTNLMSHITRKELS